MSQQSGGKQHAGRRWMSSRFCANNARWERRLAGLAVEVLTALRARDRAVRNAERRAGEALRTMTVEEGLSVREEARQLDHLVRWMSASHRAARAA